MKRTNRCCFAGHSDIYDSNVAQKIKRIAEVLILNYNVKEFWVGNYGNFDSYAATAIRRLKKRYSEIELDLVIPYLTNTINNYKEHYYDKYNNILVADIPDNTPKRFHITKANEYMVNNSDFLICYIDRSWGGAFTTYKYSKRKNCKFLMLQKDQYNNSINSTKKAWRLLQAHLITQ